MAIIYKNEYLTTLQDRLSEDNKWKRIARVEYTDVQVIHNPYLTDFTAATGTRGSAYTPQAVETTDDTVTINTFKIVPVYIDRADMAQKTFDGWMEISENQAIILNEAIETAMYANHAEYTDFDNASIGGAAGNITVSESNIDDIISGIKREIREAGGESMLERNGAFFVWRPADFEKLEKFAMGMGYNSADDILINGTKQGFRFGGFEHYSSNKLASGHLFAGVKQMLHLGICKSTYGKVTITEDPTVSGGQISGIGIISRVDFKFKAWAKAAPVLFDVLVA